MTDFTNEDLFEDQILQMLYYNRIGISKEIYQAKGTKNKEFMICYYQFFNHGFEFQDSVCNG